WIFLGAPFIERLRGNKVLTAALTAITAAVVGVILNLAVWFGLHVVFDKVRVITSFGLNIDVPVWSTLNLPAAALVLAALVAVFHFRLGPVTVLAGCAAAGLILRMVNIA
ncbi:MAG: chromate transporter, partial [Pannonibacter indicus]